MSGRGGVTVRETEGGRWNGKGRKGYEAAGRDS